MTFFQEAYVEGRAPWDTGRPQREVVALSDAGAIAGRVLDIGCGTGENAILLAERGHTVLGIDLAPRAIEIARDKAEARGTDRGLNVEFTVCDVTKPTRFGGAFDTAVDSGVFHVFDDDLRPAYVKTIKEALRPGGRAHIIVWSEHQPGDDGPRRVTRAELRGVFSKGWSDMKIRHGIYETALHPGGAKAWVLSMTKR